MDARFTKQTQRKRDALLFSCFFDKFRHTTYGQRL